MIPFAITSSEQCTHFIRARDDVPRCDDAFEATRRKRPEHAFLCMERDTHSLSDGRELTLLVAALGETSGDGGKASEPAGGRNRIGGRKRCRTQRTSD